MGNTNVLAIVGFALSFLLAPIGLILSIIAIVQVKKKQQKGMGLAIAGVIISVVGMITLLPILSAAYFGILSPQKFVANRCSMSGDFTCIDMVASGNTVEIVVLPSRNVENVAFSATECTVTQPLPQSMDAASPANAILNCPSGLPIVTSFQINYNVVGLETGELATGEIRAS